MSYTSAVTRRFKEAILWAATTRSGHMVQERDTRICMCTLWSIARIRSLMAGSRGCPGPAALYNPRIKEVNSCPPGTPWKANPVSFPGGSQHFYKRQQGSRIRSRVRFLYGQFVCIFLQFCHIAFQFLADGTGIQMQVKLQVSLHSGKYNIQLVYDIL